MQALGAMFWSLSRMRNGKPSNSAEQGSHRARVPPGKAQPTCKSAAGQGSLACGVSLAPMPT